MTQFLLTVVGRIYAKSTSVPKVGFGGWVYFGNARISKAPAGQTIPQSMSFEGWMFFCSQWYASLCYWQHFQCLRVRVEAMFVVICNSGFPGWEEAAAALKLCCSLLHRSTLPAQPCTFKLLLLLLLLRVLSTGFQSLNNISVLLYSWSYCKYFVISQMVRWECSLLTMRTQWCICWHVLLCGYMALWSYCCAWMQADTDCLVSLEPESSQKDFLLKHSRPLSPNSNRERGKRDPETNTEKYETQKKQ